MSTRETRRVPDDVRAKISNALRNRPKSYDHKRHISRAMLKYWETIPQDPEVDPEDDPEDDVS